MKICCNFLCYQPNIKCNVLEVGTISYCEIVNEDFHLIEYTLS
jgi:hypothetical protein